MPEKHHLSWYDDDCNVNDDNEISSGDEDIDNFWDLVNFLDAVI